MHFLWDNAYDFNSENILYTFELAQDYTYKEPLYKEEEIVLPEIVLDLLPPGQYFIRIKAKNESGFMQQAFDSYVTDKGKVYGTKCFYVLEDGSIMEDIYDEGAE